MILITGAGGKTGKALIRALVGDESICALVRTVEQAAAARAWGADHTVVADLEDGTAIRAAMQGSRAVYHICPNMHPDEATIGARIIRAAFQNRVEHVVYHSVLHPQSEKMNHHWQKLRVEEALFESGIPFTILQPAPYLQNLLAGWSIILERGVLSVPYSTAAKLSFVDLDDVAATAKIVLTEPGHSNAIYELAGTGPLSHADLAGVFSAVLGREVGAEQESLESWKTRIRHNGMSQYAVENLIRMFEYYDEWGLAGNPNVLRWILGREPTTPESFVQRTLNAHDTIL